VVKPDKKQSILDAILGGRISPLSSAFMKLLVSKGREASLPEIAAAFIASYKAQKRIKTLRITSAAPMSEAVKNGILAKVAQSMPGYELEMEESVDADLIGGYVLEMDSKMVDASIRRDLNDVRKQFAENLYIHNIR
jgi:F-type H+-transporting ATPase subunit delta